MLLRLVALIVVGGASMFCVNKLTQNRRQAVMLTFGIVGILAIIFLANRPG